MAIISQASLISLLALLASAPLRTSAWGMTMMGYDEDEGLFGIPISIFLGLISNPNATGAITFNGPDTLGGDKVEYTMRINVTADVPLTNGTGFVEERSNFTVASILSLEGQANYANHNICVSMFSGLAASITAKAHNLASQDGAGCEQILSEECVLGLSNAVYVGTADSPCVAPAVPQSCQGQFNNEGESMGFGLSQCSNHHNQQIFMFQGLTSCRCQ